MDKAEKKAKDKRTYVTQAVGKTISKLTRSSYQKRGFADGEILHKWSTIVGEMLSRASHPEKIIYPNNKNTDGTLHLRVGNPGLALDIQHMEPMIVERINGHFGYRAISRLKLIQAPLPETNETRKRPRRTLSSEEQRNLGTTLEPVEDPDLRKILEHLGQSVTRRNNR